MASLNSFLPSSVSGSLCFSLLFPLSLLLGWPTSTTDCPVLLSPTVSQSKFLTSPPALPSQSTCLDRWAPREDAWTGEAELHLSSFSRCPFCQRALRGAWHQAPGTLALGGIRITSLDLPRSDRRAGFQGRLGITALALPPAALQGLRGWFPVRFCSLRTGLSFALYRFPRMLLSRHQRCQPSPETLTWLVTI